MSDLDLSAIGRGTFAAVAIALPARLLADVVAEDSGLRGLLTGIIIVALGVGGFVAGRAAPARSVTHGGIAGLVAAVPVLIAGIALAGRVGASVVSSPLLGACCGVLGGYLAFRRGLDAGPETDAGSNVAADR